MLERSEKIIKIVCMALVAVLVADLAIAVFRHNPLDRAKIPELPTLASETNTNAAPANGKEKGKANSAGKSEKADKGTNAVAGGVTNQTGSNVVTTSGKEVKGTNAPAVTEAAKTATNAIAGTNAVAGTNLVAGTNGLSGTNVAKGTNAVGAAKPGKQAKNRIQRGGPGKTVELPPVIQARIDKIEESDILGRVPPPLPMGLLGIAGEYAFLRSPSGQTGLVKKGDEMGGMKLLEIGINRVLVEEGGEKKELTVFDGYGSETLLPKPNDKPNETISKTK